MNAIPGKRRSPGVSILLFVVTFGVYWFVWLYKSFTEYEARRDQDVRTRPMVAILVVLYALIFATSAWAGIINFQAVAPEDPSDQPSLQEIIDAVGDPWDPSNRLFVPTVIGALLGINLGVGQLVFLRRASMQVAQTVTELGAPAMAPSATMAVVFNVLYALARLPVLNVLLIIPMLAVALAWYLGMQRALNHDVLVAAQPPSGGFIDADPPAFTPDQAYPVTPAQTKTARFACPECATHLEATYTPGIPTPVKCTNCGTLGQVR